MREVCVAGGICKEFVGRLARVRDTDVRFREVRRRAWRSPVGLRFVGVFGRPRPISTLSTSYTTNAALVWNPSAARLHTVDTLLVLGLQARTKAPKTGPDVSRNEYYTSLHDEGTVGTVY